MKMGINETVKGDRDGESTARCFRDGEYKIERSQEGDNNIGFGRERGVGKYFLIAAVLFGLGWVAYENFGLIKEYSSGIIERYNDSASSVRNTSPVINTD